MLIGKKENAFALCEGPIEDSFCIATGANDTAMLTTESFQARCAIDIRHRGKVGGVDHIGKLVPSRFDLANRGHVGHGAACCHIGQDDGDSVAATCFEFIWAVCKDIGCLCHEVHTAEDDVAAVWAIGGQLAELVGVTGQVCVGDHFVLLIMVSQNQKTRTEFLFCHRDPIA